jgi:hypothetical protein
MSDKPWNIASTIDDGVRLTTRTDSIRIEHDDLEDVITKLTMERFRADPEGYERFIVGLLPRVVRDPVEYTFRDLSPGHAGVVSAEGRTLVQIIDEIDEIRETDGLDDADIEAITGKKP